MQSQATIWRRRIVLMLVVGLAFAIPVTLILRDEDGEPAPPPEAISADPPRLGKVKFDEDLEISMRLPVGWTSNRKQGVLLLKSADGQARVALSAPGPDEDADQLHSEVLTRFGDFYERFEVETRKKKAKIGGLRGEASAIEARAEGEKQELGIVVSTAAGKKRAYLVVAYTPLVRPGEATIEAQSLINELKLVG